MPLNPPSYSGQDVWYSPSVYINQVQAALWQPAVPQLSPITSIPNIPDPPYVLTAQQQSVISATAGPQTTVRPDGTVVTTSVGQVPDPSAAPGQVTGPQTESTSWVSDPATVGQGGLTVLLSNLKRAASEGMFHNAWPSNPTAPNIKAMLDSTGQSASVVRNSDGHTAWCATFQAYMLKLANLDYKNGDKVNPVGNAYIHYKQAIDPGDKLAWRQGDIMVVPQFKGASLSKSHATFLWGLAPDNRMILLGGNQGDIVCATYWSEEKVFAVRRGWAVPSNLDNTGILKQHGIKSNNFNIPK